MAVNTQERHGVGTHVAERRALAAGRPHAGVGDPQRIAQLVGTPTGRKTRRQRREAAKEAARRRDARAQLDRGTNLHGPSVITPSYGPGAHAINSERSVPQPEPDEEKRPGRRAGIRYALVLVALAISMMATIATGLPVLGHSLIVANLAGGIAVVGLLAAAAWWTAGWLRARPALVGIIVVLATVGVFALGAVSTIVIDGRPVLATSTTARAYQMHQDMKGDLALMRNADRLLALDQADARAVFDALGPAKAELDAIVVRWADEHDWPSREFKEAAVDLKTAAHFASLAMQDKADWVTTGDAALAQAGAEQRAAFASAYLSGAQVLDEGAARFDLPGSGIGPRGPTE